MPAAKQIHDRGGLTDHIADYVYRCCPSWSIDTLLSRPSDALQMGVSVALAAGRLKDRDAVPLLKLIAAIQEKHAPALEIVDEVCRTALSSRKRGEFKSGGKRLAKTK